MGLDVVTLIIAAISAMANVVQAYKSAKEMKRGLSAKEIDSIAKESEEIIEAKYYHKGEMDEIYNCVDAETLLVIWNVIEEAEERLKKALKDPANSNQEKDKEVRIAGATICAELRRIKTLNQGKLPHTELERLWKSFDCDRNLQFI
jgi:hypothetical protein